MSVVVTGGFLIAEVSDTSSRKLYIFIIKKKSVSDQSTQKILHLILETKAVVITHSPANEIVISALKPKFILL